MNRSLVAGILLACFFAAMACGANDQDDVQAPETSSWNTFLGSSDRDGARDAALDSRAISAPASVTMSGSISFRNPKYEALFKAANSRA